MNKFIYNISFLLVFTNFLAIAQNTETQIQYLSGTGYQDTKQWEFKISDGRKSGEWSTIKVPSVWEQEGFGKYQYGIRFYGKPFPEGIADEVGEYKYTFEVPKEWENYIALIMKKSKKHKTLLFRSIN